MTAAKAFTGMLFCIDYWLAMLKHEKFSAFAGRMRLRIIRTWPILLPIQAKLLLCELNLFDLYFLILRPRQNSFFFFLDEEGRKMRRFFLFLPRIANFNNARHTGTSQTKLTRISNWQSHILNLSIFITIFYLCSHVVSPANLAWHTTKYSKNLFSLILPAYWHPSKLAQLSNKVPNCKWLMKARSIFRRHAVERRLLQQPSKQKELILSKLL